MVKIHVGRVGERSEKKLKKKIKKTRLREIKRKSKEIF